MRNDLKEVEKASGAYFVSLFVVVVQGCSVAGKFWEGKGRQGEARTLPS